MQSFIFHMHYVQFIVKVLHVLPDCFTLLQKILQAFFIVLSYNNQPFCKMSTRQFKVHGNQTLSFFNHHSLLFELYEHFCMQIRFIYSIFEKRPDHSIFKKHYCSTIATAPKRTTFILFPFESHSEEKTKEELFKHWL